MNKKEAIELLKQEQTNIPHLRELHHANQKFILWYDRVRNIIKAALDKDDLVRFASHRSIHIRGIFPDDVYQKDYLDRLTDYETALKSIIDKYETLGIKEKPAIMAGQPPKAFIAHEGETKALGKLKAFLDALGVTYLIAEIEPSNGRLVEGQVDWSQGQANFVIILATKGKIVDKMTGKPQMGTNVADELGRARQAFRNRIILLLETGLEAHTNIGGIVRARFMPQRMDEAFTKIVKELRNWNLIRTVRVEKE